MSILVVQKIVFYLGIVNVATGLLLLFTCRCVVGSKLGGTLMKHGWYKEFSKRHCYIWWVLGASVAVHAAFGIIFLGIPR